MTSEVSRRNFLTQLGMTAGTAAAAAAAPLIGGPSLIGARRSPGPAQGQYPGHALQGRPHDLLHGRRRRARRAHVQGPHPRRGGDQRQGRPPRQAQDRDGQGGRERGHGRQRQRDAPHEALREDRFLHGHHLERQHAGPRAGGRGAQAAHHLRGRMHRLPLRQGGAEPALHLPHHEYPVGRRRHLRARHRADVAHGEEDRPHPSRLLLRPQRLRPRAASSWRS